MVQIINRYQPQYLESIGDILGNLGGMYQQRQAQKQQEKRQKLLSELLRGGETNILPSSEESQDMGIPGPQRSYPSSGSILAAAKEYGLPASDILLLQRQLAEEEKKQYRKEKLELEKEKAASAESAPYIKNLDSKIEGATELYEPLKEIKELLKVEDLQLGSINSLTPERWMNPNTQRLVTLLNKVVTKSAQLGKGVPSKARLLLEQAAKPQIYQSREAFEANVDDTLKSLDKKLMEGEVRDELIEKAGRTPKNIGTLVRKELKKFSDFPATVFYSEGAVIRDPETKKLYKKSGFRWVPIKEIDEEI